MSIIEEINSALTLPPTLDKHPGLLVGWSLETEHKRKPIGFGFGDPELTPANGFIDPILMENEGHLLTIAPTGAGKGTGCIIPALLRFEGPVIIVDPKGENALITARRRKEMGHEIVIIDPMGITGLESGSINPLDLIDINGANAIDEAMAIVSALSAKKLGKNTDDGDYWRERGETLVLGVLLHVLADLPPQKKHLGTVRTLINQVTGELGTYTAAAEGRSPPSALAGTILSSLESSRNDEAARIGRMLRIGAVSTLGGIVSFSQSIVDIVRGGAIEKVLTSTSFDLGAVTRGDPLSIYLVLPPHMLDSHGRLLRLCVHTLFTLISSRNGRPQSSTLFILDEAAQLGTFDALRRSVTLMRGYGLQTWSFWQDASQLQNLYPNDWQTMVNNCRAVQAFGANTMLAARAMADLVGYGTPEQLLDLEDNEMLLQLSGDMPVIARLPNYREDEAFKGQFDPNPFHDPTRPIEHPRNKVTRVFKRSEAKQENDIKTDKTDPPSAKDLLKRFGG